MSATPYPRALTCSTGHGIRKDRIVLDDQDPHEPHGGSIPMTWG
jgi:hypothetical protein